MLFTDEFDCETMLDFIRFIQSEATSAVHGKSISTSILTTEYAARVGNFDNYDAVSKDIISRCGGMACKLDWLPR